MMNMNKQYYLMSLFLISIIVLVSCKKDEGTGGNSSIYGKIFVKDYNSTFTVFQEEYYGPDIDVYIIYGDNKSFGDRIRTNYDGTYEFKYLRPGDYQVFAYSKDSTLQTNALIPIIKNVKIDKRKQEVEAPEIVIFD